MVVLQIVDEAYKMSSGAWYVSTTPAHAGKKFGQNRRYGGQANVAATVVRNLIQPASVSEKLLFSCFVLYQNTTRK